ncbi:ArnT family glycosyltransferase [Caenimonas soli]|uniref:ArnT family glycosyltransferase n=1 Tax=Caenimonas soli TaxID=2735555 RepID=UPI00155542F4|nr:hypothetical protein [Caenimonas soli]NPC55447.1 hypothetical protein [Caenimonas soli]
MKRTQSISSEQLWTGSFLLACSALLLVLHATHLLDSDEGLILHGAWSILNGRTLYTDFFEFVAPGSFYLIAAAWKLFGAHYWIAKSIGILAISGAAIGVWRISQLVLAERQVAAPRWAMLFGPFVFCLFSGYWPSINHNTFNVVLVVWSTFFVIRSILRRNTVDAVIGGFICGVAVWFLQHRGAVVGATSVLLLGLFHGGDGGLARWKNSAAFLIAFLVPVGGMLLCWPASLLVENLIYFPANHYLEVNRVDFSVFVLVATLIVSAAWLLRHGSSRVVWFLMSLQVILFATALQRPDLSHITLTLFPLLALFPLLVSAAPVGSRTSRFFLIWIAAGLLLLNLQVPVVVATRFSTPLFEESQHPALRYVRENCGASPYIYAGPFAPGYYFETGKLNPTRHSFLLSNMSTNTHFAEALRDIEVRRPQCMVTNYSSVDKFKYDRKNVVDEYIRSNYEVAYEAGRLQVWVARSKTGNLP